MLSDVVHLLRCPHCDGPLEPATGQLRCPAGHGFDVARQGYVNLLASPAPTGPGDTVAMVRAREEFLGAGHYAPLAAAVADAAGGGDGPVAEVGAGTAYHLCAALDARPSCVGVALDVSTAAARRAARAHPRLGSVVADAWGRLPLATGSVQVVLDVFAPRDGAELARVLAPGGRLVVLTPEPQHLHELVDALGLVRVDGRKPERLRASLGPWFEPVSTGALEWAMRLGHDDLERLVAMGPSAHHRGAGQVREAVAALPDPFVLTAAATVTVLRASRPPDVR